MSGLGKTTRHDAIKCPKCGHEGLDASTKVCTDGIPGGPQPGNYTVCAECGEFLRYGEGLTLETSEIPADMDEEQRRTVLATMAYFRERRLRRKRS